MPDGRESLPEKPLRMEVADDPSLAAMKQALVGADTKEDAEIEFAAKDLNVEDEIGMNLDLRDFL